jgi:hypothetical protein
VTTTPETINIIWLLSGIGSCLIFVFGQRDLFRDIEFEHALIAVVCLIGLCVLGPFGLAMLLLAGLITFLGSIL